LYSNISKEPTEEPLKADFSSWYLRQVTKELSDDLEKIRSSADFKEESLPVLITALQQGEVIFSKEEKQRIIGTK
jgi:ribosome assembly protein 3